jgi:hypothetical protein
MRALLICVSGAFLTIASACLDPAGAPVRSPSRIVAEENLKPGALGWDHPGVGPDSVIGGYGLPLSLRAGDTLHMFISAQRRLVTISVYRLGWYGGIGARLVARHVRPADRQPSCSAFSPGPSVCDWSETDRVVIDPSWLPGVYLARFADLPGNTRAFPFVVRSDRPAMFTVVLPFATYEAYNRWGGTSLYGGPGATGLEAYANRAVKVSFARPLSDHVLRSEFLGDDYLLVRWLEEMAYDVNYLTDYDFHVGRGLDPHAGWLFAGHSEYWSWPMWLRANAAREKGISLGFLGGNDVYWVIRFEGVAVNQLDAPVVVCYRDASLDPLGTTPGQATVHFRDAPNNTPENALVGVMSGPRSLIRGSPIDLVVATASDSLMAGTGLSTGEHIVQVAGWEADRLSDNGSTPAGIRVLFESPYVPMEDTTRAELMHSTVYTWPASGAIVYASGQPGFAWGLETYQQFLARPPLQRLLRNLLDAFVAARARR